MHYYQFNIADYRKDTGHLSPLEHYIYRTLIDWYFLDEKPLPGLSIILRKLGLGNDRSTDVQQVLNDFFVPLNETWKHERIERDIAAYHGLIKSASDAGKASAAARKAKKDAESERALNDRATNVQPTSNHKPVTNNQEPLKTTSKDMSAPSVQTTKKGTLLPDDWVLPKKWGEFALSEKPGWSVDDVHRVAADFKDHWLANANQAKSKKADWFATWRKWVRSPLNEIKKNVKSQNVQDARLDVARQIFPGGNNGTNRQAFDIDAIRTIESDGESIPKALTGLREPDAS